MDVSANTDGAFVVGVDFGTLSARALVVRVSDGAEAGTASKVGSASTRAIGANCETS